MKYRRVDYTIIIIALIASAAVTTALFIKSAGALGTQLHVDPPLTEKTHSDIGTSFQINITITDVVDLQGFDLNLTWDNTLLAFSSVDFTNTLNSVWGNGNWYALKSEYGAGYYKFVAVSTASSFTGSGPTPLCTLLLTIEDPHNNSERQTLIHFSTHKLSDSLSNPIPHIITDGAYKIASAETTLQMVPSPIEKNSFDVGTTFKTNITIQSIDGLFGFDLNITWDSTLLAFSNSYYQDTLDAIWGSGKWFLAKSESSISSYKLVALSTADSFNTTQTQTLFTLELRVEDFSQPKETHIHFTIHKVSNMQADPITHTTEDGMYRFMKSPTLDMEPVNRTCRMINEVFNVTINISDAYNVTGFKFEMRYNTTLLDCVGITWDAWGSGTMNADETLGIINGSTSGVPITGTQYLLTVQFNSTCYHVWKIAPGWTNNLTDSIFFQWANLSYASSADLQYKRGGPTQIVVGPDFAYAFSPILGDVNNNGVVDVLDLRTVAIYHMVKQGDPNWTEASTYDLNGDGIVDIFDLRTTASNFGYTYTP